ncbi:hypothetical protein [Pseudoxanthomonas winnipegensis]|uniref:hypothetical protein n=1 Tax=Pseudoxanthomonas winnipegensis TaxID=2480810 RepID=UPI0013EEEDD6|nr:hypothetical protein [Pseudoxanthomonas winnipegensis]
MFLDVLHDMEVWKASIDKQAACFGEKARLFDLIEGSEEDRLKPPKKILALLVKAEDLGSAEAPVRELFLRTHDALKVEGDVVAAVRTHFKAKRDAEIARSYMRNVLVAQLAAQATVQIMRARLEKNSWHRRLVTRRALLNLLLQSVYLAVRIQAGLLGVSIKFKK